jgi:hypothetical protein
MATAGRVDFPTHMKNVHQDWLGTDGSGVLVDTVEDSVVDIMNVALGGSPYATMVALDPSAELTAMDTAVAAFNSRVDALDWDGDWEAAVDAAVIKADAAVFDDTYIDNDITAFGNNLDDQIENIVLPRFHGGMRDVNAVMSSAFVIGESIIEGMRDRDVAKYGTDLRVKVNFQRNDFIAKGVESMLRDLVAQIDMEKSVAHYTIEANRLRIVAEKEEKDTNNDTAVANAKWDLEVWQYGANLLAAIGGGTVTPSGSKGPSKAQSAIGGVLSGAAMGYAASGGNPYATAGGAVLGLIAGLW